MLKPNDCWILLILSNDFRVDRSGKDYSNLEDFHRGISEVYIDVWWERLATFSSDNDDRDSELQEVSTENPICQAIEDRGQKYWIYRGLKIGIERNKTNRWNWLENVSNTKHIVIHAQWGNAPTSIALPSPKWHSTNATEHLVYPKNDLNESRG